MSSANTSSASPRADENLTHQLLELVKQAKQVGQIKKGANEVTKALRRGVCEFAILAADTTPPSLVAHVTLLCEEKNVPYVYVPCQWSLGKACGIDRGGIAVCITTTEKSETNEESELAASIRAVRDKVLKLTV